MKRTLAVATARLDAYQVLTMVVDAGRSSLSRSYGLFKKLSSDALPTSSVELSKL